MNKDRGVEAPISLNGLFFNPDDSDNESDEGKFDNSYENQEIKINNITLVVRQNAWHQTNANKVWPGTYLLGEFLIGKSDRYNRGMLLELGSATGALAIYLRKSGFDIITCDIDDENEVESNVNYNTLQNGLSLGRHIAHTWGTPWTCTDRISYIIASDILLYVSAYPSLVQSLVDIFAQCGVVEFIMAWNRRISESGTFFDLMRTAGFSCYHHGKCVYSFYRTDRDQRSIADDYLAQLDTLLKANGNEIPTTSGHNSGAK